MPLPPSRTSAVYRQAMPVVRSAGRYSISGKNVLDPNGNPVMLRGVGQGHGEYGQLTDYADMANRGFNWVRFEARWWGDGTWQGAIIDSYDASSPVPGSVNDPYMARMGQHLMAAKAAGLVTLLAFDSNCGATEREDTNNGGSYAVGTCTLGLGNPQTFFTTGGAAMRELHIKVIESYLRRYRGFIDFIEPIIEPNPTASHETTKPTGDPRTDVILFQDEVRRRALAIDPYILFNIGPAPNYQYLGLPQWFNPAWVGNTMWTIDMLDNAVTGNPTPRVNALTTFRTEYNVPVSVQQIGSMAGDDPSPYPLLRTALGALNTATGGSVHWMGWEWVGPYVSGQVEGSTTYAPYTAANTNAARTSIPLRMSVFQDRANDAVVYPV